MQPIQSFASYLLLVLTLALSLGAGCGSDAEPAGTPDSVVDSGPGSVPPAPGIVDSGSPVPDATLVDAGADAADADAADAAPRLLTLEPSTAALQIELPGAPQSSAFTAYLDGIDVSDQVSWTSSRSAIATVAGGLATATGQTGGVTVLTATLGDRSVTAELTVKLLVTVDPDTLADTFVESAVEDPDLHIDYPFPDVVLPRNTQPIEVQWTSPGVVDVIRLTWTEQFVTVRQYVQGPTVGEAMLDAATWHHLTTSGRGAATDPVTLTLARTGFAPRSQTLRIAQGDLPGVIVAEQHTGTVEVLRQSIQALEPSTMFGGATCFGCHSVSRNGRLAALSLDTGSPFPIRVVDLSTDPVGYLPGLGETTALRGTFSTFSPAGNRLVYADDRASSSMTIPLKLLDLTTATELNANVMGAGCSEPEWSPDGTTLAAICGLAGGGWGFDASVGNLTLGTWSDQDDTTMAAVDVLVPDAAVPGRPSYPSWSADSRTIVFSSTNQGSRSTGDGVLHVVARADGALAQLTRAAAGAPAFYPAFAPTRAGGYHWIAFTRRASFGHKLTAADKQIWVAAVDLTTGAVDPSHPPFFLQGQRGSSMSGVVHFSREVCRADAATCSVGIDCCSGTCVGGACRAVDANVCVADTNACSTDAACCAAGSSCADGFCVAPFPL